MAGKGDIRVTGDDEQARRIQAFAVAISDLRPFWPKVASLTTGWLREQFETEGVFFLGRRWTPLSPGYAARKHMLWGNRPILQASGQMRRAFSRPTRHATPSTLTLTWDDSGAEHGPIAQFHQTGDGVPKRPIIFETLPPHAELQLAAAARDHVSDLLRRL